MKRTFSGWLRAVVAGVGLSVGVVNAATVSYTAGDLFVGFRATNNAGATLDYLVNIGQASTYRDATSVVTVANLGNIGADLSTVFGSDWATRSELRWSIAGTPGTSTAGGDPGRTLYATKAHGSTPFARANSAAQAGPTNKLASLAGAYLQTAGVPNASTANSAVALVQATTDTNSYASFQSDTSSYSYFSPPIEVDFGGGVTGAVLDLYRLAPATGTAVGTPGDFVGTFSIDGSGALTFTPAAATNGGTVWLANTSYSVSEADAAGKVTVTVSRGGGLADGLTVNVATADGTAHAGTDYTSVSSSLTFGAGEKQKSFDVLISNRPGFQNDRTFSISLSSPPPGSTILSPASAQVTILEANASVKFTSATYAASETAGKITATLLRGNGVTGSFTVDFTTSDGTAHDALDYTGQTNTQVSFGPNETQKTVDVAIVNRSGFQGNRSFTLALSNASAGAAVIAPSSATATILEADLPSVGSIALSAATYQVTEPASGDVQLTITAIRSGGQSGATSIDVAITGGTASAGTDYVLPTAPATTVTLNWADQEAGAKSFDITIKSDATVEPTETINLALQNGTNGVALGTVNTATVSIFDADTTAPTLTVTAPKPNSATTAASLTFRGQANDNQGVARVEVRLNGSLAQTATPSSATASFDWSANVVPQQGTNTAEVVAYDLQGNASAPITFSFKFANLRPQFAGDYNGLIVADAVRGITANHHGLIAIKVGPTGTFTGKVTLAGATLPISGIIQTDGSARFGKALTPTLSLVRKGTVPLIIGDLALTLDTVGGLQLTGGITDGSAQTVATIPHADRAVYTAKPNPAAPLKSVPTSLLDPATDKGHYTALFEAGNAPNHGYAAADFPQGDGYATITVAKTGIVKVVGKLADGSTITYANALSTLDELPFFVPLYSKAGFVAGTVKFDATQPSTDATGLALKWFKPANLPGQKLYASGWPNTISTDLAASKYVAPTASGTVIGVAAAANTTTANIVITTSAGGLLADQQNDGSLGSSGKIALVGAPANGAPALKVSFAPATGALSGSFKHPVSGKPVTLSGIAYQKTKVASGYFLYTPPAAGAGAASGLISVVAK